MRRLAFFLVVFVLACGGPGANRATTSEAVDATTQNPAESKDLSGDDPVTEETHLGLWTNSSCGERKYQRKVNFLGDGTFTAIDEVAPCPQGAQCVWSGVIHWGGLWKENGDLIEIEPKFEKAAKTPETVPNGFVVLGRGPFSLGEQDGEIVCPYQRMR